LLEPGDCAEGPGDRNELTQAKDAIFKIDNLSASRATNTFTDAISA